jgi:hypothetical protein
MTDFFVVVFDPNYLNSGDSWNRDANGAVINDPLTGSDPHNVLI